MRIAYFSPLNPCRSGISDYSEELLPHLAEWGEIDLFVDGYSPTNRAVVGGFPVHDWREYAAPASARRYDVSLYQMGNSPYHAYIYRAMAASPGVVVLHEPVLHHLVVHMTVGAGDEGGYIRELGYCHGPEGAEAARRALRSGGAYQYLEYPACRRAIEGSLGVVVHSDYARSVVAGEAAATRTPVRVIRPHVVAERDRRRRAEVRATLGVPEDAVVFGVFGLVTPAKRVDVALGAYAEVRRSRPNVRFLVVGEVPEWYDLWGRLPDGELGDHVHRTGYVGKEDLVAYIEAVDVCLSLRWPTMGETSATLLRAMAAGRPSIVSDVGSFAELPETCCRKVPVGDDEREALVATMLELVDAPEERQALGERAEEYARTHHDVKRAAQAYATFIRECLRMPL